MGWGKLTGALFVLQCHGATGEAALDHRGLSACCEARDRTEGC